MMCSEEGRHANKFDATYNLWTDGQTEYWDQTSEDSSEIDVSDYVTVNNEICPYASSPIMEDFNRILDSASGTVFNGKTRPLIVESSVVTVLQIDCRLQDEQKIGVRTRTNKDCRQ